MSRTLCRVKCFLTATICRCLKNEFIDISPLQLILLAVPGRYDRLVLYVRVLGNGWIFRGEGLTNQGVVNEIVAAIENESPRSVRTMLDAGWRLEAAQALYIFLTRLEMPLIPSNIQSLVLDDNNRNIPPEIVAADVLGLIQEELSARHRSLIGLILHLLDRSIKLSPADELRGHTLPVSMMPLFFNIENHNFLNEWRRILSIFVELIRQASTALSVTQSQSGSL